MNIFKLSALISVVAFFSLNAFAIPEGPGFLADWRDNALPFFNSSGLAGVLRQDQGRVKIVYKVFENSNAQEAIVILPGRTEPAAKYAELIQELAPKYSIYIMDHRGQGASDRLLKDPQIGYVGKFQDYVDDFSAFMEQVVKPSLESRGIKNCHLLAHSMGGAIGTLYLEQNKSIFRSAVLSSPMLEINLAPYGRFLAEIILKEKIATGHGKDYVRGYGPYDPNESLEQVKVTHSEDRFKMDQELLRENPEFILGGASYHWLAQALPATDKIRSSFTHVSVPLLILEAGDDAIVGAKSEEQLCKNMSKHRQTCEIHKYTGAWHEIFMEKDAIRNDAMARTLAWFAGHGVAGQ